MTVLSGMSNLEQMRDNLSYMRNFQPLDEKERDAVRRAQEILHGVKSIPCTTCHYCTDGCPKKLPIPDIFSVYNKRMTTGEFEDSEKAYEALKKKGSVAADCIACKKCEEICPQHINISEKMKEIKEVF